MKHTYDIAHERDLAVFVRQHFANLGERICLALFEADSPIVARGEPLAAVVAVEACVAHAIAIGNHPSLVVAVVARAAGLPIITTEGGRAHGVIAGTSSPVDFLNRVKEETKIAVAEPGTAGPAPQTVEGAHGEKIRIVRAGDVAGCVIKVLADFEQTSEVINDLGEEMTFALYGRLSTEIAKLITQGLR